MSIPTTRFIQSLDTSFEDVAKQLINIQIPRSVNRSGELFSDNFSHNFPQPQYLGAKFKHLPWIRSFLPRGITKVADAFAGSQSVSFFFKQLGYEVSTNDFMNYSNQIGKALIENKEEILSSDDIAFLFSSNKNPTNFFIMEKLFTDIFFVRADTKLLDAFRSNAELLSPTKKSLALAIMNRTLTRKITMGHFAHRQALVYANNPDRVKRNRSLARPIKDIFIELADEYNNAVFDNGKNNRSYQMDAINFVKNLKGVDLIYFDPPYCDSHADYQSFYHLLETFVENWHDKKFVNGTNRYEPKLYSGFDNKRTIVDSLENLFAEAKKIPYWIISYNDRSYPDKAQMLQIITKYKKVDLHDKLYLNSVGGKGSVKNSNELLFVCY